MILAATDPTLLPESVPTILVLVMAVAPVAGWVALHLARSRGRVRRPLPLFMAAGIGVGFVAMLMAAALFQRWLVFATNGPLWPLALLGAVAVEICLMLYALERRTVPRGAGLALGILRVGLVVLVIVILAQPVRTWETSDTHERFVAVLVDESASMRIRDGGLSPSERLRLAEALGIEGARRPHRLDDTARTLDAARDELGPVLEWLQGLNELDEADRLARLQDRQGQVAETLESAAESLEKATAALEAPLHGAAGLGLDDETAEGLNAAVERLKEEAARPLVEARSLVRETDAAGLARARGRVLGGLRQTAAALAKVAPRITALSDAVDATALQALPEPVRQAVRAEAEKTRLALVRDVLLKSPGESGKKPSLLETLEDRYSVRVYAFALQPSELDVEAWRETGEPVPSTLPAPRDDEAEPPADEPLAPAPSHQQTDLAAALQRVAKDLAGEDLAGVLLLTDGRHNAAAAVEPIVRRLGLQGAAVSSVAIGGARPPRDAGVIGVDAPETVYAGDKVYVAAELKLDGFAGEEVAVELLDGEESVDMRTVRVPLDVYRTRVQLGHEPEEEGLHRYRVAVAGAEGDVLPANNAFPLAVHVTDDRTKLLLVEGLPRWDFRYLKNLFADRDESVQLQYVLFRPDRIEGMPKRPDVHASVARDRDEVEATALPEDEAEWMKFDVVVLGDVAPEDFEPEALEILERFVTERGGTLIVIAGPNYMPHAFGDTPLADLAPVAFEASPEPILDPPEKRFRWMLTAEGRASVLMRQKTDPAENLDVWDDLPDLYWRHAITEAKEGAAVLAYAMPEEPPEFLKARLDAPADTPPAEPDADLAEKIRAFERTHALVVMHRVSLGHVLFLATDRSWRMRYRVGDTRHHRFWGQVLRWATGMKLRAGTEHVRLGTDRLRYAAGDPVKVMAKVVNETFAPIEGAEAVVRVFCGEDNTLRLTRTLDPIADSAGRFEAHLGDLPSGAYRVELDVPEAKALLAADDVDTVSAEFTVDPVRSGEMVELAPDRGMLAALAGLSGGVVVDPSRAGDVLASFGPGSRREVDRHEFVIWDSWPLFVVMVLMATAEWLLRKKVGLA